MNRIHGSIALNAIALFLAFPVAYGAPPDRNVIVVNEDPVPVEVLNDPPGAVAGARRAFGSLQNPMAGQIHDLVTIAGPGVFISARVGKLGGASDITNVRLFLDGQQVIAGNPAELRTGGLTEMNPYGIALYSGPGGTDTIVMGLPFPLAFEESLTLVADVVASDTGIVQISGTVIYAQ